MIPRLFGRTSMYSKSLIEVHFWVATIGVVLYIASMWIAGVMQGLMWRAVNVDGTLTYTFIESVKATLSVLRHSIDWWSALSFRYVHDGLQRIQNHCRSSAFRSEDSGLGTNGRSCDCQSLNQQTPLGENNA